METVSYQNDSKSASVQAKHPTPVSGGRPTSLTAEGGVEGGRCRSPSPSDKEEQLATALVRVSTPPASGDVWCVKHIILHER